MAASTRYEKLLHPAMPERLYAHLLRTAAEWAIDGDIECAVWFMRELQTRELQAARAAFNASKNTSAAIRELYGKPCVLCGEPADTIDHIVPLSRGGTNDLGNLQPMCNRCNVKKSDSYSE